MPESEYRQALAAGYGLESYRIIDVLGVGGFGVTYLAQHTRLGHRVALKEYLPNEFAVRDGTTVHPKSRTDEDSFQWGLERFLDEAKTLTRFRHTNIVRVIDYFEANNTAYFVMDYEVGKPLNVLLANRVLTEGQLRRVLWPILDGLKTVHKAGVLHRDIKPANIFIRQQQESPVLLDFGSARNYVGQHTKNPTSMVSPGYSPGEQYFGTEGDQGPWTDIYALAGVCYKAVTGETPLDALRRMNSLQRQGTDPLPKLAGRLDGYSASLLRAIDTGLSVVETDRPQSIDAWQSLIEGRRVGGPAAPPSPKPPLGKLVKPSKGPQPPNQNVRGLAATPKTRPRNRKLWVGAAAAAAALVAVVALFMTRGPTTQQLTIDTVPADAEVTIAGQDRAYGSDGFDLEPGNYQIVVAAPGYATHRERVSHGSTPTHVRIALTRLGLPLTIETSPADAEVSILSPPGTSYSPGAELPWGEYRVRVAADGFGPKEVELAHGPDPTRHRVALEPVNQPFTISPSPAGASVRIMNVKERYQAGMMLPPGDYRVEVSAAGYQTTVHTVVHGTVPTDQAVTLSTSVNEPFTILTDPPQANVHIVETDETYRPGLALAPGDYRVQISAAGYAPYQATVRHEGKAITHRIKLRSLQRLEPEMVRIAAGSFQMGDLSGLGYPREHPVHAVAIPTFALSVHEVTYAEFDRFSAATEHQRAHRIERDGYSVDSFPVSHVSWDDATAYAKWLSGETGKRYRLPTEAEWEYAARAGAETAYSFGNHQFELCQWANVADQTWAEEVKRRSPSADTGIAVACADGEYGLAAADSFVPNAFGLKNMHGNVWEWVADCYRADYGAAPTDGSAWGQQSCAERVVRGGAANSPAKHVRSAHREPRTPDTRVGNVGFRLAHDLVNNGIGDDVGVARPSDKADDEATDDRQP